MDIWVKRTEKWKRSHMLLLEHNGHFYFACGVIIPTTCHHVFGLHDAGKCPGCERRETELKAGIDFYIKNEMEDKAR